MRNYELMYIVHPDLDESGFKELNQQVEGWIKDNGGTITKSDVWGRRQLAYLIRKQKEGNYVLLHLELEPSSVAEIERQMRLQESILRHQVIVVEEDQQEE